MCVGCTGAHVHDVTVRVSEMSATEWLRAQTNGSNNWEKNQLVSVIFLLLFDNVHQGQCGSSADVTEMFGAVMSGSYERQSYVVKATDILYH